MIPNPPPNHPSTAVAAATEPPSSASSSPTPLLQYYRRRKRHQPGCSSPADPVPTSTPPPIPTDSDPSSHKKTRELPNLSECHACHFRIDVCNGKHRLQALYSEWRIVLLCKKCFLLVESSRMCSYCFEEASTDCFSCRGCKRSVHMKCFDEYKSIAPWSYSCSGSQFSVCVDCWVPKSLASSSRVSKSRRVGEKLESSRVSDNEDEGNMLEDVVNNANCPLEKNVEVAERAREKASKKAVVARRAVELASSALNLVAKRDGHGAEVVDDEQLAIQLHRAMNSSPRIMKNFRTVNLSCLAVPRMPECNEDSSSRSLESGSPSVCGKLETCTNNKLLENPDKSISEPSVCVGALDPDSSINMKCLKIDGIVDMTTSAKDHGACPGKCDAEDEKDNVAVPLKEGEGSCSNKFMNSSGDDNSMDSESQSNRENSKSTGANVGNCNEKTDRYLIKYSKRRTNLETTSGCKPKFIYQGFLLESQASATGIPLNCSKESRTFSNSSFQSCAVPLQTSFCRSEPGNNLEG